MFQVATVSLNYITPLCFKVSGGGMKLSTRMVSLYKLASLLWLNTQLKVRNLVGFHLQLNSNTLVALWNTAEAGKKKHLCSWWFLIPWFKFPNYKIIYAWDGAVLFTSLKLKSEHICPIKPNKFLKQTIPTIWSNRFSPAQAQAPKKKMVKFS